MRNVADFDLGKGRSLAVLSRAGNLLFSVHFLKTGFENQGSQKNDLFSVRHNSDSEILYKYSNVTSSDVAYRDRTHF